MRTRTTRQGPTGAPRPSRIKTRSARPLASDTRRPLTAGRAGDVTRLPATPPPGATGATGSAGTTWMIVVPPPAEGGTPPPAPPPPAGGAGGDVIVYATDASGLTLPAPSIAIARTVIEWSTVIGVTPNTGDAAAGFVPTVVKWIAAVASSSPSVTDFV